MPPDNHSKNAPSCAVLMLAVLAVLLLAAVLVVGESIRFQSSDRYRCDRLCDAITAGDTATVARYLADGSSASCRCRATSRSIEEDWTTPLHKAVGNPEMMRLILRHGVDVNRRNSDGETALFDVVRMTDGPVEMECAKLLLEAGIDLNVREREYGMTVVHNAASSDSVELLRCLLENGGDPNVQDRTGSTPMHMAGSLVKGLREETLQILLDHGADPDIRDNDGRRSDEPPWYHAKGSKNESSSSPLPKSAGTSQ